MCVWDSQSAADMSLALYLVPWMNGYVLSFWNVNQVDFLLLARCLYNKQNNLWLLGDVEFLFLCSAQCLYLWGLLAHEMLSWTLGEKFHITICLYCIVLYLQWQGSRLRPIQLHLRLNFFPLQLKYLEKSQICDLFVLCSFETKRVPVINLLLL